MHASGAFMQAEERRQSREDPVGEKDTKILYVRMPEAMHRRLRVAAAKAGRPIAQLAREAVVRYLETMEESDG